MNGRQLHQEQVSISKENCVIKSQALGHLLIAVSGAAIKAELASSLEDFRYKLRVLLT